MAASHLFYDTWFAFLSLSCSLSLQAVCFYCSHCAALFVIADYLDLKNTLLTMAQAELERCHAQTPILPDHIFKNYFFLGKQEEEEEVQINEHAAAVVLLNLKILLLLVKWFTSTPHVVGDMTKDCSPR